MASLQELQANFNAAFDVLPVGQRIPWGGGTIYSMGGGRAYYDGPNGYQVLTKGQDVAQLAASNPYIAQQWAGEGYDLAPAQTFSTRPEQVMQAPEPVSVAAPPSGSPASAPKFDAAGQYFANGSDQAGFTGTYKDPTTGKYMLPRYESRYDPMVGDVVSTQVGWYEADGQNVGDMMRAYDMNGNADAANNVAIQDTSDTLLDKLIKGGILAGVGAGLWNIAGASNAATGAGAGTAATGAASTLGSSALGPAATAVGAAGKIPSLIDTLGSALGVNGSTAATLLGGLLGSQSSTDSKTTANKLDPQMQAYLYGAGGLLPAVNSTLQSQLATGGLNNLQRQGLTTQQNYLNSPEYAQQFAGLRNYGQGLLASGVAANPFAARGINGLL